MRRVAKVDKSAQSQGRVTMRTTQTGIRMPLPDVELATSRNDPQASFYTQSLWVYGDSGVGKTTFAAEFENSHQFMFEPGALYLRTYQKPVTHWLEWVAYKEKFRTSNFQFAICDGMEDAFELCFNFMCEEVLKIEHPNDEKDYGKSWAAIYAEFVKQFYDLIKMPNKGCIFISHACERLFKPAFGEAYDLIRPALSSKPLERLLAKVDFMGYIWRDPASNQNKMRIRPDGTVMAKVRAPEFMLYSDGSPVWDIPLGNDAKTSYKMYKAAFHNQLEAPAKAASTKKPLLPKK
jgi:hypothetical protein